MSQRNSACREQPNCTTSLRRSPRLFRKHHTATEDPKTPDPKSRTNRVPHSHPPSLSSANKGTPKKTHKIFPEKVPKKVEELKCGSKISEKLKRGSRKSATLNGGVCLRRSPRLSGNENIPDVFVEKRSPDNSNLDCLSNISKAEVGIDPGKQVAAKTEKRVTHRSSRGNADDCVKKTNKDKCNGFIESASIEVSDGEDLPDVERAKVGATSNNMFGGKLEKRLTRSSGNPSVVIDGGEEKKGRDIDEGKKVIGVKRKRKQVEVGHGIVQGWTEDQELALQRAYFAAKPTPHFWKKVAKLVPGKSAQDCFDKVHANHLTPPQPRSRSRASKINSSSFSLSASTLLKSAEPKTRRPSGLRQKSHLAQKTVRQLLQKHYNVDQDYEADLFSVLESTFNPSTRVLQQGVILSTPERAKEKPVYLKKSRERSSSAHKKQLSRLSSSCGATLLSPPVLKLIKNKALHEKYIDQLHCREAKRRAAFVQAAKSIPGKENRKQSQIQKINDIKAAKNALVFDAKDVIHQFQRLKASSMSNYSDFDDDGIKRDDDEGEDEP